MRRGEEELERRAKEPRMLKRLQQPQEQPGQQQQLYPYKRAPPPPPPSATGQRAPKLVPKQPRDIETLITNNLSREDSEVHLNFHFNVVRNLKQLSAK